MQDFIARDWQAILGQNRLDSFDTWWSLDAEWFEEPNQRRGGWSGVSRVALQTPDGGSCHVFLKRQQDHTTRTWRHPLKGILTFEREMQNILAYQAAAVPALQPVYFAQRTLDGKRCAVLVTVALDGFSPLQHVADRGMRRLLIGAVADTLRRLHAAQLQHNCLYPKHIFVRIDHGVAQARLIDLEKSRRVRKPRQAMLRDLDSLSRHADHWSLTDKLRFLLLYLGVPLSDPRLREAWQALAARAAHKQRRRH